MTFKIRETLMDVFFKVINYHFVELKNFQYSEDSESIFLFCISLHKVFYHRLSTEKALDQTFTIPLLALILGEVEENDSFSSTPDEFRSVAIDPNDATCSNGVFDYKIEEFIRYSRFSNLPDFAFLRFDQFRVFKVYIRDELEYVPLLETTICPDRERRIKPSFNFIVRTAVEMKNLINSFGKN